MSLISLVLRFDELRLWARSCRPVARRHAPAQTSNCAVRSVQARIKHERSGRTLSWLRTRLAFAEHLPDSSSEANLEHRSSPLCKDFAVRTRSPALVIQKWG